MMKNPETRTTKSIKNGIVSIAFMLTTIFLQFFSRKVFLNYLGSEVLGLNTTVVNLLQFLNLAELGIGTATTFSLYKPLRENDEHTLNDIVSLQGHLYKRIACVIIGGALLLSLFFPLIFKKIALPLWYTYASFAVMLLSSLLGYFVNYKQVLLSANQEEYKITYSYRTVMMIKIIFQMSFIYIFQKEGYVWWLIWEGVFAIIASISLNRMIKKNFPFIVGSIKTYKTLKASYGWIITKIKQLFFHKIGAFVLSQCGTIIIYAFLSLSMVAYYGNYMMIINGVALIIRSLSDSLGAGIGNLIAEGNYSRIKEVFIELFSIRFFIAAVACYLVYNLTPEFISLWIGNKYLLSKTSLILLTVTLYISVSRFTVDAFINGYGIFQDIYAPLIEGVINIGFSIILGKFYGLNGILAGILISLILVIIVWKPYFLFTRKMNGMAKMYIWTYIKHLVQLAIVWGISYSLISYIGLNPSSSYLSLILYGLISLLVFGGLLFGSLYLTKSGIHLFASRMFRFMNKI